MENAYPVVEFEAEVNEGGAILLPRSVARRLSPGAAVTVRVTLGVVDAPLRTRGVTEDEVERIASCQFEPRDNVLRFLRTEGLLSRSPRFRRPRTSGRA